MQTDAKQLYKLTAEREGKSEQMYKDVGSFVFKELSDVMKNPKKIRIKLRGVGFWHLRKKRMEIKTTEFALDYTLNTPNLTEVQKEKAALRELFKKRLVDYEKYILHKKETNIKKDEFRALLETSDRKDES